jgi:hypothetical protein
MIAKSEMLADIGTKALDPMRFEILRDAMTGIWFVGSNSERETV